MIEPIYGPPLSLVVPEAERHFSAVVPDFGRTFAIDLRFGGTRAGSPDLLQRMGSRGRKHYE
jgi:hypothetical protein